MSSQKKTERRGHKATNVKGGLLRTAAALSTVLVLGSACKKGDQAGDKGSDKKTIVIGITADASGQYAASGDSDKRGVIMAINEFNAKGGVLGRQIKWVHADTESTPATGSRIAERMITQDKVDFLVGAMSSGVANAISQVAQKYGVVYLNTNSSSPSESGENCHRTQFVWDGNGNNFAQAAVKGAIGKFGKKWLLITNDYGWGHDTSNATRKLATENADSKIKTPGNVFYNGYWATRALLETIEKAKTTNNHAVIKELEQLKIPANVRMQHNDAYMNPKTHQLQQTIYLATANMESKDPEDLFKILTNTAPDQVVDKDADAKCKLEPFEATPVYPAPTP